MCCFFTLSHVTLLVTLLSVCCAKLNEIDHDLKTAGKCKFIGSIKGEKFNIACNYTDFSKSQHEELVYLTYNPKFHSRNSWWLDRVNISVFPPFESLPICCVIVMIEDNHTRTCELTSKTTVDLNSVTSVLYFFTTGKHKFHQRIHYISPMKEPCPHSDLLQCEWQRFVYSDATSVEGYDRLTIAPDQFPTEFEWEYIVQRVKDRHDNTPNEVATFQSRDFQTISIPQGTFKYYRIAKRIATPNKGFTKAVYITIAVGIILIGIVFAALAYTSKPRKKTIGFIYCQCVGHKPFSSVMNSLESFMESNCVVEIKSIAPSEEVDETKNMNGETDTFIRHLVGKQSQKERKYQEVDYVIYAPFPELASHEPSYGVELDEIGAKFSNVPHKVEVEMPWSGDMQRSLWGQKECKKFKLMQDFWQLIRHIHPSHCPSCLDWILRKNLSKTIIESRLREKCITNPHIFDLTNPKFLPNKESDLTSSFDKPFHLDFT